MAVGNHYRRPGSFESTAQTDSEVDVAGAYMDLDTGGTFARFGAKGPGSIGLKLRTIAAGVALTVLTFTSAGAATFGFDVNMSSGKTFAAQAITATSLTVSSGTTAVQALTATNYIGNAATSGAAFVQMQVTGTSFGGIGSGNWAATDGTTDMAVWANTGKAVKVYVNNTTLAATFASTAAVTFTAGISATTGTFNGDVQVNAQLRASNNSNGGYASVLTNPNATGPRVLSLSMSGAAPNDGSLDFIKAADSGTTRFQVFSNGGISNFSANNVNLSDERVKTFAPAFLDGALMTQVFREVGGVELFKYNDQTHRDWNIGHRAQRWLAALKKHAPEYAASIVDPEGWTMKDGSTRMAMHEADLAHAHMAVTMELDRRVSQLERRLAA